MKPLILDFKIKRTETDRTIPYKYDAVRRMNIILVNGIEKPFIDINKDDIELMTKTKVRQESDDDSFSISSTDSAKTSSLLNFQMELTTKTFVKNERDDERSEYAMELTTKTRGRNESDDEHFDYN